MEFGILGPLEVRTEAGPVALAGIKPRAVLAVLLLHRNEAVHVERLALALWGEDAPASAVKTVQVYIARLRKALGDAEVLATTPAGYCLRVRADELDAERFARLVEDGRRALDAGQAVHAAAVLREALGLWRGPPLAELAFEPFAQAEIVQLQEQRLAALETRVEADLAAGRHVALIGELRQLVAANPTRERLAGQLMLALYRCGQQADALEAFHAARRVLVAEIGVEPGPELRRLETAILRHDAWLEPQAAVSELPQELDAATAPTLVGRNIELAWLRERWERVRTGPGALVTLIGRDGIGKSRLVAELAGEAHRLGTVVVYCSGRDPPETVRAALGRAGEASRATLLVVDDVDEAGPEVLGELEKLRRALADVPVLALALARDAESVADLGGDGALTLEPSATLRRLQHAVLVQDPALDARPATAPMHVPRPPSPTIGRRSELDQVRTLLAESSTRIVTLVGTGGVGKTRVAIEAARCAGNDFADGAWFVSLAALSDPKDVPAEIGRRLDVAYLPDETAETALKRHLRGRRLLLVLDNFEHLLTASGPIAELVTTCEELAVLVTSREPLRVRAERVVPIEPLPVEDAVALFCSAVIAGGHSITSGDAAAIRDVCERVDRLPLAVELAAARVGVLGSRRLLSRLDRALPVLVGGARDQPERQRTLRATIEWSFRLLDEPERDTLTRLAVFPAGATLEAIEAVTHAPLDLLESLTAKQLVRTESDRLALLWTVREFLLERFDEDPNAGPIRDQMARWMLEFARDAVPRLWRRGRRAWADRIARELPNLTAALTWAVERGESELALALAGQLGTYARQTRSWPEGMPYVEAALTLQDQASPAARAQALLARAVLTGRAHAGPYRRDLEESLRWFEIAGDRSGQAICRAHLAIVTRWEGRAETLTLADAAVALAQESGDDIAYSVTMSMRVVAAPDYDSAATLAEAAVPILSRIGDEAAAALACSIAGYNALAQERDRDALHWLERASGIARDCEDPFTLFHVNSNLGLARLFADDLARASRAFRDALSISSLARVEHVIVEVLEATAALAARVEDLEAAARLEGAAFANDPGSLMVPTETRVQARLHERFLRPARARLGDKDWNRHRDAGAALTLPEAANMAAQFRVPDDSHRLQTPGQQN